MSSAAGPAEGIPRPGGAPRPPRLSKAARIGTGLLLTLVGLFLLVVLFPTSPSAVETVVPVAAAGILAVWVGGILLGQGSRS